ncbi:Uncharacterised protein [Mycobacterium tuberculosis]|nr:Uncharacterised protein [Mycobacterium tuberculosis]
MTGIFSLLEFIDIILPFFFDFVNNRLIFLTMKTDNLGRNTDNRHITRYICYDNCCSTDLGIFTNFHRPDNLGMG